MATLQTFQTQFASVDGVNVAYRRFGKRNTFPLLSTIFKGQSMYSILSSSISLPKFEVSVYM
ncbi:hypothetical protein QL093DRAFT_2175694, partial [Fusarium oxysporum]